MADELVRSRSVIGLLDGGLRLWVVARPALARIMLLSGFGAGLISLLLPTNGIIYDFRIALRLVLLLALLVLGEAAGGVTVRTMLNGGELGALSTWRGIRSHWLAAFVSWFVASACAVFVLAVLERSSASWLLVVSVWAVFALVVSALSLLLVAAIVEQSGSRTMERVLQLTKGQRAKAFRLGLLWGLAVTVFAALLVTWLFGLTLSFVASALGPLRIDIGDWDSASWSTLLALPPLMVFAPGSAGVWGLFLIDLRVRREGLDLARRLEAMEGKT